MRVFDLTIRTLVDENYVYARALSYLGIDFYLHPDKKLKEVCEQMGLQKSQVLKAFYLFDRSHRFSFAELNKLPLEIVVEYLKHAHHIFIKDKLPYIAKLISRHPGLQDMKLIFPEFVEEFVNHIYEEEDTLFHYLEVLQKVDKGHHPNPLAAMWLHRRISLKTIYAEHCEEDELKGIRELAEEHQLDDLLSEVITREIKAFDREMWYHAEIENKILFPKAIALEAIVKEKMTQLIRKN